MACCSSEEAAFVVAGVGAWCGDPWSGGVGWGASEGICWEGGLSECA